MSKMRIRCVRADSLSVGDWVCFSVFPGGRPLIKQVSRIRDFRVSAGVWSIPGNFTVGRVISW